MKSKLSSGKVFVNVCCDDSIAISAVILGENCPHAVPDKEGNMSDTYDVCINSQSKDDQFNREIIIHINKEYAVELDADVTLPKIKGNFKGSHTPAFSLRDAKKIPMTEEESVEDMFRALAEKKNKSEQVMAKADVSSVRKADSSTVFNVGYMEKEGRGTFTTWNNRFFILTGTEISYYVNESKSTLKGTFPVNSSCTIDAVAASSKRKFQLQITDHSIKNKKNKMLMNAPDAETKQEWISKIQEVLDLLAGKHSTSTKSSSSMDTSLKDTRSHENELKSSVGGIISGAPVYVMKSKLSSGKVFVNVCCDDSIAISAVILGENCPHAVPDKEGNMSDTYDVCINSQSKDDQFNREIIIHINKEYAVELDADVTLPKIKGNFKGSHTP
eukprot:CAMPEP_0114432734 /NCGR_PEP_ID=MMETSP0103-20121206/11316_1 /TAXON_ID=37642 ORGANISM="Paraphysomonas imperforata, Strain PA2" /NCGR_SAMPLE_ID=MMETSP0103 /ASSEMBLY_ACC=CAM_ASM_000201 /LENGTH=386 /DNA_ID=CAMNT_0001602435 /DNA_START=1 /DNA_END=1158 /DNA_ORIENTATION=-